MILQGLKHYKEKNKTTVYSAIALKKNVIFGAVNKSSRKIIVIKLSSHVRFFTTPRTVASQAPLSMGFPRQEYWSGLPFPF